MTVKPLILFATAIAFAASPTLVLAQNSKAPGQMMQENGSVKGQAGASGYAPGHMIAPGHMMQNNESVKGTTGASGYAPGRATTGAGAKSDVDVKAKSRSGVDVDVDTKAKIK